MGYLHPPVWCLLKKAALEGVRMAQRKYFPLEKAAELLNCDSTDLIHFGANGQIPVYALVARLDLKKYDHFNFPDDGPDFYNLIEKNGPVRLWQNTLSEIEATGTGECNVVEVVDEKTSKSCSYVPENGPFTVDVQMLVTMKADIDALLHEQTKSSLSGQPNGSENLKTTHSTTVQEGVQKASLVCRISGREALPVRSIPYVVGRFFLAPDEVIKQLARRIGPPFARLQNTTAFHVSDGQIVNMPPKEWDEAVARAEALESRLTRLQPSDAEAYAAWIEESKHLLPAAVFVWKDELEADFNIDIEKIQPEQRREGDDKLNFSPRLSNDDRRWVLEGAYNSTQIIDWQYWQSCGLVRAWEAVALSCGINPHEQDLNVDELVANHQEINKRLSLLLKVVTNENLFSPVTLDGRNTAVKLSEFVAWWTIEHYPLSPQLHRIGEPIVFERQEAEKRRKGRYTIQEAAELLERDAGEKATAMEKKLVAAVRCGELPTHDPGQNARKEYDGDKPVVRTFVEEVYWDALNAWLTDHETRISYRFPDPTESENEEVEIEAAFTEVTYNDHAIDWRHWVKHMPALTAAEAACLMSALDPDVFESLDQKQQDVLDSLLQKGKENISRGVRTKAKQIQRMAERQGKEKATPKEWLDWAYGHGLHVHSGFRLAVKEYLENVTLNEANDKTDSSHGMDPSKDWIHKARAIANSIGLEKWNHGERQITQRKIVEKVAEKLAGDLSTHGKQGQRSASNIRTVALKGWKFNPPDGGSNGSNGSDD